MGETVSALKGYKDLSTWGEAEAITFPVEKDILGAEDMPSTKCNERDSQHLYLDALHIEWTPAYQKYGGLD